MDCRSGTSVRVLKSYLQKACRVGDVAAVKKIVPDIVFTVLGTPQQDKVFHTLAQRMRIITVEDNVSPTLPVMVDKLLHEYQNCLVEYRVTKTASHLHKAISHLTNCAVLCCMSPHGRIFSCLKSLCTLPPYYIDSSTQEQLYSALRIGVELPKVDANQSDISPTYVISQAMSTDKLHPILYAFDSLKQSIRLREKEIISSDKFSDMWFTAMKHGVAPEDWLCTLLDVLHRCHRGHPFANPRENDLFLYAALYYKIKQPIDPPDRYNTQYAEILSTRGTTPELVAVVCSERIVHEVPDYIHDRHTGVTGFEGTTTFFAASIQLKEEQQLDPKWLTVYNLGKMYLDFHMGEFPPSPSEVWEVADQYVDPSTGKFLPDALTKLKESAVIRDTPTLSKTMCLDPRFYIQGASIQARNYLDDLIPHTGCRFCGESVPSEYLVVHQASSYTKTEFSDVTPIADTTLETTKTQIQVLMEGFAENDQSKLTELVSLCVKDIAASISPERKKTNFYVGQQVICDCKTPVFVFNDLVAIKLFDKESPKLKFMQSCYTVLSAWKDSVLEYRFVEMDSYVAVLSKALPSPTFVKWGCIRNYVWNKFLSSTLMVDTTEFWGWIVEKGSEESCTTTVQTALATQTLSEAEWESVFKHLICCAILEIDDSGYHNMLRFPETDSQYRCIGLDIEEPLGSDSKSDKLKVQNATCVLDFIGKKYQLEKYGSVELLSLKLPLLDWLQSLDTIILTPRQQCNHYKAYCLLSCFF